MAYMSYYKLWGSEFDNIVSKRDKLQELNISQSKLEVHNTYEKDEKITTNIEPNNNEHFINESYLYENLLKTNGHLTLLEKITTNSNYKKTNNLLKRFDSKSC